MNYEFTEDWFTGHINEWIHRLSDLVDTPCRCLEIGSFEGRSTVWLADNILTHPKASLICIDPLLAEFYYYVDDYPSRLMYNIQRCSYPDKVEVRQGFSQEVLPRLRDLQFDFAYVDGSHEARDVIADWVLLYPLLKKGALVCFDDYGWQGDGGITVHLVKEALDVIMRLWSSKIKVISCNYQVWIRKTAE